MAKKSQTQEFVVRLAVPEGATASDVQHYVQEALETY